MPSNSYSIGLSIPADMNEWLNSREGKRKVPNKSKLFQDAVNNAKNPEIKKTRPMDWLIMFMGLAFGVGCLVGACTLFCGHFLFKTTLFLLGAVVLLAALVAMMKEAKRTDARMRKLVHNQKAN